MEIYFPKIFLLLSRQVNGAIYNTVFLPPPPSLAQGWTHYYILGADFYGSNKFLAKLEYCLSGRQFFCNAYL